MKPIYTSLRARLKDGTVESYAVVLQEYRPGYARVKVIELRESLEITSDGVVGGHYLIEAVYPEDFLRLCNGLRYRCSGCGGITAAGPDLLCDFCVEHRRPWQPRQEVGYEGNPVDDV